MSSKKSLKLALNTMQNLALEVGKEQFSKTQFKGSFLLIVQFWIHCGVTAQIDVDREPDCVIELEGTLGWNLLSKRDLLSNFFRTSLSSEAAVGPLVDEIQKIEKAKGSISNFTTCAFMYDLQLTPNLFK